MKKVSNKKFYFLLTGLALAFLFCFSGVGLSLVSAEENRTTLTSATLSVVAYSGEDLVNPYPAGGTYLDGTYNQYSWSNIDNFKLNFSNYSEIQEADSYSYRIDVDYAQKYITDNTFNNFEGHITLDNVLSGTVTNLGQIGTLVYHVNEHEDDINVKPENKTHKDYGFGWGIYRFTIRIGRNLEGQTGAQYYDCQSIYVYVAPTTPSAAPQVEDPKIESSISGLQNAYRFDIANADYKFANQNLIVWYVRGEGIDGKKYVLTPSDIGTKIGDTDPFAEYPNSIFTGDTVRTGHSFFFDSNGIAGQWEVFCVVYNTDGSIAYQTNMMAVTTGEKIEPSIIIWIIVAAAVVLLAIIIVIIVVTKKKEKVY